MEPNSDEEHTLVTPAAASPKSSPVAPDRPVRPALHAKRMTDGQGTECKQPTFDSSDDEDVILHAPIGAKNARKEPTRLLCCKEDKVQNVSFHLSERKFNVHHYPLNLSAPRSVPSCVRTAIMEMCESVPGADMNVYEYNKSEALKRDNTPTKFVPEGFFNPGIREMEGLLFAAHDIADVLGDSSNAVIVSSRHGGDACKLLVGCASAIYKKKHKTNVLVGNSPPLKLKTLKKVVKQAHALTLISQAKMAEKIRLLCDECDLEAKSKEWTF